MGMQEMLIEKLGHEFIQKIDVPHVVALLEHVVEEKVKALKEDKDKDGVVDGVEIAASLGIIAKEAQKIAGLLK